MQGVLALNGDYRVLRVLPVTRAVTLVLLDKAEVLEEGDGEFRSANFRMPIPSVIRLKYVVKIPTRTKLPVTRRNVLARDRGRCAYCQGTASTVDHVIPRSKGGRHAWENVVAACLPCNAKKDDRLLKDIGWSLKFKPWAPERSLWLGLTTADAQPAWSQYLPAAV